MRWRSRRNTPRAGTNELAKSLASLRRSLPMSDFCDGCYCAAAVWRNAVSGEKSCSWAIWKPFSGAFAVGPKTGAVLIVAAVKQGKIHVQPAQKSDFSSS